MPQNFDERYLDPKEWELLRHGLIRAIQIRDGEARYAPRVVGRWAQSVIENAEALESAAALLRRVEAQVIDESVRK
jgi:threonine dehydratase